MKSESLPSSQNPWDGILGCPETHNVLEILVLVLACQPANSAACLSLNFKMPELQVFPATKLCLQLLGLWLYTGEIDTRGSMQHTTERAPQTCSGAHVHGVGSKNHAAIADI